MKGRIHWMSWALLAIAVGCQNSDVEERTRRAKESARALDEYKAKMNERTQALREQLKQGLQPVVDCALEKFRKEAETRHGDGAVKQAKITAGAAGEKKLDDGEVTLQDVWELPIRYVGKDAGGKDVDEQWVAQVVLILGSLDCVSLEKK